MDWNVISHIADILGIASFFVSFGIFRKIYKKTASQKSLYRQERQNLLVNLQALQQNMWCDLLRSPQLQSDLQKWVFEYQIKYLLISSPRCAFHAFRCSFLLGKPSTPSRYCKISTDINFLIARLTKKE